MRVAFDLALKEVTPHLQVPCTLTRITPQTLNVWRERWASVLPAHPAARRWDWDQIARIQPHNADNLELAIWSDEILCGLMVGHVSKRRTRLLLDVIEGAPFIPHPLQGRVLDIGVLVAEYYAKVSGPGGYG